MANDYTTSQRVVLWYACLQWVIAREAAPADKAQEEKQLGNHVAQVGREVKTTDAKALVDELGSKFQALRIAVKEAVSNSDKTTAYGNYREFVMATFPRSDGDAAREIRALVAAAQSE